MTQYLRSIFIIAVSAAAFLLPPLIPASFAQEEIQTSAKADSLKRAKLERAQAEIISELKTISQEIESLKKKTPAAKADSTRLTELEQRHSVLEGKLERIKTTLANPHLGDEYVDEDGWGDSEDDEPGWDEGQFNWDFDKDWHDDSDEDQFAISSNVLKKYPSVFQWPFPISTKLGESFVRYNRAEGFYIGISQPKRLYWHSKPRIVGTGSLGYGFASHRWRYSLGLYLPFYFQDYIVEFGGEGHSFTDSKDQWIVDRDENTVTAFFAKEDYMDYFGREGFSVSGAWYYRGPRSLNVRFSTAYLHDTYENLGRRTNWSLFGGDKIFRFQPMINAGNINSMMFAVGATTTPNVSRSQIGWNASVSYETSGGFTKGDYEFSQITMDIRRYQPVTDYLNINLRVRTGASDGLVPLQRSFELGGISTLPGYRYKEFAGTHAALMNAELILHSNLSDDATGWVSSLLSTVNLILFYDAGAVNGGTTMISDDYRNGALNARFSNDYSFGDWKTDAGVAIGSADGDFRIGLAWRLDRSSDPNFILRFSRPF